MSNRYLLYLIPILLFALLLTGFQTFNNQREKAIQEANELYQQGRYEEAGEIYSSEFARHPEEERLNYNLACVKYKTGHAQEALEFYQKGPDWPDKYLLMGNISFQEGKETMNPAEKINLYQQAIQFYREGIENFPREIILKYNYEYVKEKLEELQNQMQDQKNQSNDKENSKGEEEEKENKEENQPENEENFSRNEEDQREPEEQEKQKKEQSPEGENDKQNGNEEENNQKETGQEKKQIESKLDENLQNQEGNPGTQVEESGKDEGNQDQEEIMQVLKMLEAEEEESLKNNQSLYPGTGEEEKYDW